MWSFSNLFCVQSKVHRLGEGDHKGTSIKIPGQTLRISHENHRRGHCKCGLWASSTAPPLGLPGGQAASAQGSDGSLQKGKPFINGLNAKGHCPR